jgi:hypothetical protein
MDIPNKTPDLTSNVDTKKAASSDLNSNLNRESNPLTAAKSHKKEI